MNRPSSDQPAPPFPDPTAAVMLPDPGPAYRALLAGGPIRHDGATGWWVVTGYRTVAEALTAPGLLTRPLDEPVPATLVGRPGGAVFAHLVRMTDDPASRAVHHAIQAALASVVPETIRLVLGGIVPATFEDERRRGGADWPTRALFRLPVAAVGALLGLSAGDVHGLTPAVRAFARGISPAPFDGPADETDGAVEMLVARIGACLAAAGTDRRGILGDLVAHPALAGAGARDRIVANAVGLLFQSLDATAGLIGNTIGRLAADADLLAGVDAVPRRLDAVLRETLRFDPPIHTTRRFVAARTRLGDASLQPGDRVLVVLAAANRDPAYWSDPERFDAGRTGSPDPLSFGIGPHRCPGQRLAWEIALAGVRGGLRAGLAAGRFWSPAPRLIPSPNARIPEILDHDAPPAAGPSPVAREEPAP